MFRCVLVKDCEADCMMLARWHEGGKERLRLPHGDWTAIPFAGS